MISSSAWRLFRANALCLIRRLGPLARTNPLLAFLAILAPASLVVGSAWAGSRGAATLATLGDGASAGVALTVAVVFALAGFNVRHLSSAGRYLDDQIRSAPLSRLEVFLGTVGIPFTALFLALSVLSLIFFAPLSYAGGTPPHALFYLVLFEVAVFYAAGTVGEVAIRAASRQPAALLALLPLAASWAGAGVSTGGGAWPGIARPLGREILNPGVAPVVALPVALVFLPVISVGVWVSLVAFVDPPERQTFSYLGRRFRSPHSRFGAVLSVTLKRMGRDRSVQRHVALVAVMAGILSGATSILLPSVAPVALGGVLLLAAFSVSVVPLATCGTNGSSRWLWRTAPISATTYALGMVVSGFGGGLLAVVAPAAATLPFLRVGAELGSVAVAVAVVLLLATGVGFLVPCTLDNASEQILSYAVLGGSLACVFTVASRVAALNVPEAFAGAGLGLVLIGLVLAAALSRETGRREV